MKKYFGTILAIFVSMFASQWLVAIIYVGSRVVHASINKLLPLDGIALKADMMSAVQNVAYRSLAIGLILLFYFFKRRKDIKQGLSGISEKSVISIYLKAGLLSIALGFVVRYILAMIIPVLYADQISENVMIDSVSVFELFVVCTVVPITEEILFRCLLVNDLEIEHGTKVAAVVSLSLFVMLHTGFNIMYALFSGILITILYLKYRNVKVTIISHMCLNFIGMIDLSFLNDKDSLSTFLFGVSLGSIAYLIFSLNWIRKAESCRKV